MSAPAIAEVAEIAIRLQPKAWSFARASQDKIAAHWQKRREANPHLYNGRVLLMHSLARHETPGGVRLEGGCFIAEYKDFLAWKDFGFPGGEVTNLFAMAALRAADGDFLLGEMGAATAAAGKIYFPAGTPEPDDLAGDRLDLAANLMRELKEETGLDADDVIPDPGWTLVRDGSLLACMKILHARLPAAALIARTADFLAQEKTPELTRLVPVSSVAEIDARMPLFMQAYLRHAFAGSQRAFRSDGII